MYIQWNISHKKKEILLFATTWMVRKVTQTKTNTVLFHLYVKSTTNCEYYKKNTLRHRKQTSGYQWREGSREGQDRSRGLRATKLLPTK